jgi:dihydroflavonol-4-reductase
MKTFVTGGTGFIGNQVVRRLLERGHDVTCLVRSPAKAAGLSDMGAAVVQGDITDRESMREGMTGADVVFHIAAWYEVGLPPSDEERMEQINVGGTENVLGLAVELGIPRIVYTSTVGVLGDTYGRVVDETYKRGSAFDSAYDRSKYQAHQMAERYIAQGAPIIVVMPASVYGPGDHSVIAEFLRLQLRGLLPAIFGADTGFTFVHVEDVAEGHVLAAEKGEIGQAYVLAGDVMTAGDALQLTARLAGIAAPLVQLDSRWVAPLVPLAEWVERFVALPLLFSSETLRSTGRTWWVTSAKAERGLGYTHRSVEEGMAETVLWEAERLRAKPGLMQMRIVLVLAAVGGLLSLGLLLRRRETLK